MTAEKLQKIIGIYRDKFNECGITGADYIHGELLDSPENGLAHCYGMLEKMEGFIKERRMDKAYRWLGFIQGVLWSHRVYTLVELKNHSRPDPV